MTQQVRGLPMPGRPVRPSRTTPWGFEPAAFIRYGDTAMPRHRSSLSREVTPWL